METSEHLRIAGPTDLIDSDQPTSTFANPWASRNCRILVYIFEFFATVQIAHHYMEQKMWVKLPAYLAGQERLPYQRRVLLMFILRPLHGLPMLAKVASRFSEGQFTGDSLVLALINITCMGLTGWIATRFYRKTSPDGQFAMLVYPVFLFCVMWTFTFNPTGTYPYDFPSLAFYTAGLYLIYVNHYKWLLLVMLVGSINRETTMFLIPVYLVTALFRDPLKRWTNLPWLKISVLALIWAAVKLVLSRCFVHNDPSEAVIHFGLNLPLLSPVHWPEVLDACGYLLPILWLLRKRIKDCTAAAGIYVFPLWFVVMMIYGFIMEVRIYGELCGYVATVSILLFDSYIQSRADPRANSRDRSAAIDPRPLKLKEISRASRTFLY